MKKILPNFTLSKAFKKRCENLKKCIHPTGFCTPHYPLSTVFLPNYREYTIPYSRLTYLFFNPQYIKFLWAIAILSIHYKFKYIIMSLLKIKCKFPTIVSFNSMLQYQMILYPHEHQYNLMIAYSGFCKNVILRSLNVPGCTSVLSEFHVCTPVQVCTNLCKPKVLMYGLHTVHVV